MWPGLEAYLGRECRIPRKEFTPQDPARPPVGTIMWPKVRVCRHNLAESAGWYEIAGRGSLPALPQAPNGALGGADTPRHPAPRLTAHPSEWLKHSHARAQVAYPRLGAGQQDVNMNHGRMADPRCHTIGVAFLVGS